jgi:hypothetical protein
MKRLDDGSIVLKDNLFLRYVWGVNFWRLLVPKTDEILSYEFGIDVSGPRYPRNCFSLYFGSFFVFLSFPLCFTVTILFCLLMLFLHAMMRLAISMLGVMMIFLQAVSIIDPFLDFVSGWPVWKVCWKFMKTAKKKVFPPIVIETRDNRV